MTEEALLCGLEGRACSGLGLPVEGAAAVACDIGSLHRSGEVVVDDGESPGIGIIYVPLLQNTPDGQPLNYATLSEQLESLRSQYQSDSIEIRITGFAKVVGDLIDGMRQMQLFFAATLVICGIVLFW